MAEALEVGIRSFENEADNCARARCDCLVPRYEMSPTRRYDIAASHIVFVAVNPHGDH